MSKPPTKTEQLMQARATRRGRPYDLQTPGDVLLEAVREAAAVSGEFVRCRDHRDSFEGIDATDVQLDGHFDLDAIARAFLHKVMASG